MLYAKLHFVALAVYATLSRTTFGAEYVAYAKSSPTGCFGAGPSDRCTFYCDDNKFREDFDCGNVGICDITCDQKQCFDKATITATNSGQLNVFGATGEKCYQSAVFHLPDSGNAYFTADASSNNPYQKMTVNAGTHTQNIYINCAGGRYDACQAMTVNAQTAQSLYINVGKVTLTGPVAIHCPQNTVSGGPYDVPCYINSWNKATLWDISIHTLQGVPYDAWIHVDSTQNWSNVALTCTDIDSKASVSNADILSTRRKTNKCYNENTRRPTFTPTQSTKGPTRKPTPKPTRKPTPNPTRKPTPKPTGKPTANPTRNPTRKPTRKPTNRPTPYPTLKPTPYPTFKPTLSPTFHPTPAPTANPTPAPTANPTPTPTANPTRTPTVNPSISPTKNTTRTPTADPTTDPTADPTVVPTNEPTVAPIIEIYSTDASSSHDDERQPSKGIAAMVGLRYLSDTLVAVMIGVAILIGCVLVCICILSTKLICPSKKAGKKIKAEPEEQVIRIVANTNMIHINEHSGHKGVAHIQSNIMEAESISLQDYYCETLPPASTHMNTGTSTVAMENDMAHHLGLGAMQIDAIEGDVDTDDTDDAIMDAIIDDYAAPPDPQVNARADMDLIRDVTLGWYRLE